MSVIEFPPLMLPTCENLWKRLKKFSFLETIRPLNVPAQLAITAYVIHDWVILEQPFDEKEEPQAVSKSWEEEEFILLTNLMLKIKKSSDEKAQTRLKFYHLKRKIGIERLSNREALTRMITQYQGLFAKHIQNRYYLGVSENLPEQFEGVIKQFSLPMNKSYENLSQNAKNTLRSKATYYNSQKDCLQKMKEIMFSELRSW